MKFEYDSELYRHEKIVHEADLFVNPPLSSNANQILKSMMGEGQRVAKLRKKYKNYKATPEELFGFGD